MFRLWRRDVWLMSGWNAWPCAFIQHRGKIQRAITPYKRTVWEPTGTEWVELACLRELCLLYGMSEVSHLLCALFGPYVVAEGEENFLKWQRWIGNLRKVYKGQKKKMRMRHEMAGRTNRGRFSRVWNCKNIVYSFTTLQLLIQSKISTWNSLMSVYLMSFMMQWTTCSI